MKLLRSFMVAAPFVTAINVLAICWNDRTGSMVYENVRSTIAMVCLIGLLPSAIYGYICLLQRPPEVHQ